MQISARSRWTKTTVPTALLVLSLTGCGGGGGPSGGPAIDALAQTISFAAAPTLSLPGTGTVSATASSGLPVSYSSKTPTICSVDASSGVVNSFGAGTCTIAADQTGDATYAPAPQATLDIAVSYNPNQTISFAAAPTLTLGGAATVSATASSGLPVSYSSTTPSICSVNGSSGLVTDLTLGTCTIAADQAGNASFNAAPQATLDMAVSVPAGVTVPGVPTGVTASLGTTANTVVVNVGGIDSGGNPIISYTVTSTPAGMTASSATLPITVTCPGSCSGYAFSVFATNGVGDGGPSTPVDVLTIYDVVETFYEPDTQPKNSIFTGSFTLDSTTASVSGLAGTLTESMTGTGSGTAPYYDMTQLHLTHQLSSRYDATLGGLLVTTFLNNNTNTLYTGLGGDGWAPGSGMGMYYNFPGTNPGNAYAMIFVGTADPTATPTQSQINKLAYADCQPGGMMGSVCMTGTTVAGYGTVGTMSGYPISLTITKH